MIDYFSAICRTIFMYAFLAFGEGVYTPALGQEIATHTVCEILGKLTQMNGQSFAVAGRLSGNLLDGTWLSQDHCPQHIKPKGGDYPYAIRLACLEKEQPLHPKRVLLNEGALRVSISQLRQTTPLRYYDDVRSRPGQPIKFEKVLRKETWSVFYGEIVRLPENNRFSASFCAAPKALRDFDE